MSNKQLRLCIDLSLYARPDFVTKSSGKPRGGRLCLWTRPLISPLREILLHKNEAISTGCAQDSQLTAFRSPIAWSYRVKEFFGLSRGKVFSN